VRILTVGNMYPPHHLGGYEILWRSAVRYLRSAGHEVRVLTTDHRDPGAGADEEPDVHRELRWYWRDHDFPRLGMRARLALERSNAATLDRHLAEFEPDVVSWWAMGGMSLSLVGRVRGAGIPACAVVIDDWLDYGPKVDGWTRAFASRPALSRAASALSGVPSRFDARDLGPVLFPSETTRGVAMAARPELEATETCPPGIDPDLFRPPPARDPWSWRLLYVGRIDPRKGIALAVRALAHLPGAATLAVVGGGDEGHLAELRELAEIEGVADRVSFEVRGHAELAAIYGGADVLVFPVLWREPWGLVPLESMACGTPVVASGRGGSGEYLRDGENAVLFEPDDGPGALAAAVERLGQEDALRERVREGGLATAASFHRASVCEAVAKLCERAAGSQSARGSEASDRPTR
jgi:glycogen synthase